MNEEQAHLAWRPAQRHPDFYKVRQQKDPAQKTSGSAGKKIQPRTSRLEGAIFLAGTREYKSAAKRKLPEPITYRIAAAQYVITPSSKQRDTCSMRKSSVVSWSTESLMQMLTGIGTTNLGQKCPLTLRTTLLFGRAVIRGRLDISASSSMMSSTCMSNTS